MKLERHYANFQGMLLGPSGIKLTYYDGTSLFGVGDLYIIPAVHHGLLRNAV